MYLDFEYADKRLSDFDYIVCKINQSGGVQELDMGFDITFNTVKDNHSSIHYQTSSSYDGVYTTPPFEIMKNPCGKNSDELYMTTDEVKSLTKWLNRREYHKFKPISIDEEITDIHYFGSFNIKKITVNDRVVGLSLTFTSNTPYGFGERVINEFDLDYSLNTFSIFADSDEFTTLYPNVTITCKQNGDLRVTNILTGNTFEILGCSENEIIYVNGEHKYIDSDNKTHKETSLYSDFNYHFLDIVITADEFNENIFKTSIPCKIVIDYSPIRKVGM